MKHLNADKIQIVAKLAATVRSVILSVSFMRIVVRVRANGVEPYIYCMDRVWIVGDGVGC